MPIAAALADFNANLARCDSLIIAAHRQDATGAPIFNADERGQITTLALLNTFIAWESFVEAMLIHFMCGQPTLGGTHPSRHVVPPNINVARDILRGTRDFFDYGNQQFVKRTVRTYFTGGHPFEPHLSAIENDLQDLRTMRNASAHINSTTQASLETLALRTLGIPSLGITVYQLMTSPHPSSASGESVYAMYQRKLAIAATQIANG
jgi:hypothetical protein